MATIVNNPGGSDTGAGAAGWIIGLIVLVLIILAAIFILPRLANTQTTTGTVPQTTGTENGTGAGTIPPVTNNTYNTTINASSTTNANGTTTR